MTTAATVATVGTVVALVLLVTVVVVVRRGWLYRWPRYVAWRRAKSRRDRGRVRAGGPSDGGGTDPTAGF